MQQFYSPLPGYVLFLINLLFLFNFLVKNLEVRGETDELLLM
ncbi:hypothetical protein SPHINGO8BC_90308 [Sphingobacterium multivorum]|uniref:Uncharacterized protein n=1 Tax=Sphingobacterium multivorum TaxID=28454 RepID=A0A654DQF6_SPHMU|nr:hypothetical protein SPHINGO8BC_90308 [Sphingobacterium multivorum]